MRLLKSLGPLISRRLISKKPFYITTPIFYVNAAPHLGHLYSMLLCDVRHRWELLKSNPSFFTTGTDEHGLKIQTAAEKKGINPKEFTDLVSGNFKSLATLAHIDYDRFIRTTDKDHLEAVHKFWNIVNQKGYIYEGEHSGWYSISDETFYPETQIKESTDSEGNKVMVSIETGTIVQHETETNYFFKLSSFKDKLIEHLEANPEFISPKVRYDELLRELKTTQLNDLSISRPSSRLKWGIPVPNDDSQKIYVWFDALVNYLTSAGFSQFTTSATPLSSPWPATHLIGKDIIRFHCIYWPSFLMAAGIELPKQVIVHGHWLSGGIKMSKSIGNVIDPISTAEYYDMDVVRFFLCEHSVLDSDGDFTEEKLFHSRENIISKFANLITRCCGAKFDIARAIKRYSEGEFKNAEQLINTHNRTQSPEKDLTELYKSVINDSSLLFSKMDLKMEKFLTADAIREMWPLLAKANQLFQHAEPWTIKSSNTSLGPDPLATQDLYIFTSLEAARISSILMQPVMPELAAAFLDRIGVASDKRNYRYATFGADLSYGVGVNKSSPLPIKRVSMRVIDNINAVK